MAIAVSALNPHVRNFSDAVESYLANGGEARYLPPIIDHFGDWPLSAIAPFDVYRMAEALFPDQSGGTRNRQALTPCRAVLIHAYERGWAPLIRLRRFKEAAPKRKSPASHTWLHLFARQCGIDGLPHLAALVLFMATTGARVSEATALCWNEVDLIGRTALLLKTKTDVNSLRHLTDEVSRRLHQLAAGQLPEDRVFRYRCRYSVNERIAAVCARADIPYKSAHVCGRHSFGTNSIALGIDVRSAMEAGGWKSEAVFLGTYVHPRAAGRKVADRFNGYSFEGAV